MTANISELVAMSNKVAAKLLGGDDSRVQMLRLRTRNSELIITPGGPEAGCTMVVLQHARSRVE